MSLMNKVITVVDYGVGNLFSVKQAFEYWGAQVKISSEFNQIKNAEALVLPGVGAFGHGMEELKKNSLHQAVLEFCQKDRPFLGICLGMQLMFEKSFEYGEHQGLGLIEGEIKKIQSLEAQAKVPHIGWAQIHPLQENTGLLHDFSEAPYMYFVHSYQAQASEPRYHQASCRYFDLDILAIVQKEHLFGCQFHPEKSGAAGLKLIQNFLQF